MNIAVAREEDLTIDVDVPPEVIQALEQSGAAVMAPAVEKEKPEVKEEASEAKPAAPAISEADLAAVRRQADEANAQREAAAKSLQEEKTARAKSDAEFLETKFGLAHTHHLRAQSEKREIEAHISNWETAANVAKRDLTAAKEAGDAAAEAEAIQAITKAQHRISSLEIARGQADEVIEDARREAEKLAKQLVAKKAPEAEPEVKKEEPPPPKKMTEEDWIGQFPRKTASWLKENRAYVSDPVKNMEFVSFVKDWAEDYGQSTVNGPEFMRALTEKFTPKPKTEARHVAEAREPEVEEEEVEIDTTPKRRNAAPAAPVSRSTLLAKPSGSGATAKVKLSAEQYAIAPSLYPEAESEAQARALYAADLLRARSEGKFEPRE